VRVQVGVVFTPLVTYENPPTYFRTNKVTYAFQEIVRTDTFEPSDLHGLMRVPDQTIDTRRLSGDMLRLVAPGTVHVIW